MKKNRLSIITVNYKSWDLLEKYLASFAQYPPQIAYEIIVVDNYPEDGIGVSFADSHPEIKMIANKGNFGFSHGCNLGADHASGDYLLFLNPDIELTQDNAIVAMFAFLQNNLEVGIASCRAVTPKGIGREINFLNPWLLIPWIKSAYKKINKQKLKKKYVESQSIWYPEWVTGSIVLISSQLFHQVGRWNEERYWMYYEDPDLCARVRKEGKQIALLRHVTIKHIDGGISRHSATSTIRSKVETIVSAHNYIQENTQGIKRIIIHFLYLIKTLSPIVIVIIALPFFWTKKYQSKFQILINVIRFYINAVGRGTWKSPKLKIFAQATKQATKPTKPTKEIDVYEE